ncbi:hypothetical protein S1361_01505 [Streptomyces cyanogenus]|uniref:Uncharacterized protein n=1 Tax=Streptomyces cyanogenus TaxID=80860 RepID=A0ABX7TK94_STRCY|nr:hypothetical protein S1361_01505 [Streptomyces cyanogenus]
MFGGLLAELLPEGGEGGAMDVEIVPNNINSVRLKLKRLVVCGIRVETEQGLFTQPRPWPPSEPAARPPASSERAAQAHGTL